MRRTIILLVACLAIFHSGPAQSQGATVLVRAGEHRDYTRLILQLPEQNQWQLSRGTISARLDIEGPSMEFDLTETFSRIPRTRLRDLRASAGGLNLYIACDCDIQAREDIPQFLIIDIIGSGSHTVFAPMTAPRPPRRPLHMMSDRNGRAADPRRAGTQLAQALRRGTSDTALQHALTLSGIFGASPQMSPQEISDVTAVGTQRAAVALELGRVLASSVSSGKLQAATEFTAAVAPERGREGDLRRIESDLGAHFSVAAQARTQSTSTASAALHCPDASILDPSEWFARTDTADILPTLGNLFNDFDQAEPRTIREAARHFILRGFGAEARMVLSLLEDADDAAEIMTAISYLVDMSEMPETIDLAPLAYCGPMGSLWAFLASRDETLPAGFSGENLVQALQILPPHLRLHLGPEAVQRLAALGRLEEAHVILTSLDRVAQGNTGQLKLARATLDLPEAQRDKAHVLETTLSPQTSDDDLIFLLSRREAQAKPVEAEFLEAATTRLFALRGTPTGREIASLVVRAKGRMDEFQDAFNLLDGREAALPDDAAHLLRIELLEGLVSQASDTVFLTLMFEQRPWDLSYLPDALVEQLVARLRALGFDMQADLLERSAHEYERADQQAARDALPQQQIAISPIDTRDALATNSGITAPRQGASAMPSNDPASALTPSETAQGEADILRARAAQARARNERANTAADMPAPEALASTTTEPDPEFPGATEPEPRGQVPNTGSTSTAEQETAILSHSRDALGESAELRARLQTLLEEGIQR